MLGRKGLGAFGPLSASGGAAFVLGPGLSPALQSLGIDLTANPDFSALCAFGEIEQVRMVETAGIAPFAGISLVGSRQIDGIEAVIVPNGGGCQADFEFLCRLVCHGVVTFGLIFGVRKGAELFRPRPEEPSGPKIPCGAAKLNTGKTRERRLSGAVLAGVAVAACFTPSQQIAAAIADGTA